MEYIEQSIRNYFTKAKLKRVTKAFFTLGSFILIFIALLKTVIGDYIQNLIPTILKEHSSAILLSLLTIIAYTFYTIHEKISTLEIQENFRERLNNLYLTLKKNEHKLNNIYINSLQEEIIKEATRQLDKIFTSTSDNILIMNDEYERVQYIRHLFNNNQAKEIIALTYDHNEYFISFWGGLNHDKFIEANIIAARKAKIKRYFVFNKSEFDKPTNSEKQELYNDIIQSLKNIPNIETHQIWEENISNSFPKNSFLLIDDYISSENKLDNNSNGYLAFGNSERITRIKKRIKTLDSLTANSSNQSVTHQ